MPADDYPQPPEGWREWLRRAPENVHRSIWLDMTVTPPAWRRQQHVIDEWKGEP